MNTNMYIFVLDRGFVVTGRAELHPELAFCWKVTGHTVRRWGTTRGLAELCDGPTAETVLDVVCERVIPFRSVIEMLVITTEGRSKWEHALAPAREKQPSPRPHR